MVTLSAVLQSSVQTLLRPAIWIPFLRNLHMHREQWKTEATKEQFKAAVLEAVKKVMSLDKNTEYLDIHKMSEDGSFIRILAFTKAEWLDIVEFKFKNGVYEVRSYSTGIVPLIVPFACVLNVALFFVPFLDHNFNKNRMRRLRQALTVDVQVLEKGGGSKL